MSLNKVMLIGHLGADPEIKAAGNSTVARLNIATSETWMKDGQKQTKTEWHRVTVWGKLAEICGKHLAKGRQVYIEGKIQTRSYQDKDNQKRYATEIVASTVQFLGSASGSSSSGGGAKASKEDDADFNFQDFGPEPTGGSDDIPF